MINIRQFIPSDLEAVLSVYSEAIRTTGARYYDQDQVSAWAKIDNKEQWLKSLSENITLVAIDDEQIVGFGDMNHSGYIDHVFILPKYQGQGILQQMVREFEAQALSLDLKEITTEASLAAMPVARRLGYEIVTKQIVEHNGQRFVNYHMRKTINS